MDVKSAWQRVVDSRPEIKRVVRVKSDLSMFPDFLAIDHYGDEIFRLSQGIGDGYNRTYYLEFPDVDDKIFVMKRHYDKLTKYEFDGILVLPEIGGGRRKRSGSEDLDEFGVSDE